MLTVNDLMTSTPQSVLPETSLSQVIQIMQKEGFRQLPVIDEGKLIGIITDRDIRLAVNLSPDQKEHTAQKEKLCTLRTADYMTPEPVTIPIDMPAYRAAEMLRLYKFGALIVVDEQGRVVGIITVSDFLKSFSLQQQTQVAF